MSQAHEATGVFGAGFVTDDHQYPPRSASNQAPQGMPDFSDGSGLIFSMYLGMAEEEDKKMAENWKADADGILIFAGLFSAAVASLLSVSIQDIRPNPQDTSNFYLANIYQTVADPNRSNFSSPLPSSPPPFSPPNYAVCVNALWFMSLVISISCALLAALLQQWARRYLRVTQPRYGLHKRARIRTFFFEAVMRSHISDIGALPTLLLHASLFLFFAGLVVFLWNVNLTIFKLAVSWVSVCTALYGLATFMPVMSHNSTFYTPLSPFAWYISFYLLGGYSLLVQPILGFDRGHLRFLKKLLRGIRRTVEEAALSSPSKADARALMLTFASLDEDHELERFFSGFPGFRSSTVVDDPLPGLNLWDKERLSTGLIGLFDRTFSSDLLPEFKIRRAIICAKALDPAQFPFAFWDILRRVMSEDQHNGPQTAEFVRVMRSWGGDGDQETALLVRAIFTSVVARVQRLDDSWLISAPDKLGIPESDLRNYATDGDSSSLSSLIDLTRHEFNHYRKPPSWPYYWSSKVLEAASEFNVQDTSPDLQHKFCALWNQIVLKAQNDDDRSMATYILRPIRNVYIALHQGTDAAPTQFSASTRDWDPVLFDPTSYPRCDGVSHIHDSASTTFARAVLHDDDPSLPTSIASPDVPSSSVPAPPHVVESPTDMPTLDDFHPRTTHKTTTESLSIPVTSPDPATADASGIIIPRPTSANSTSTPPPSSTSPTAVTLQHNADPLAPSDPPNRSSSASHPILGNTESHRSAVVPAAPSTSTGPSSAADLSATAKDDGSPKPGPGEDSERDVHPDTPSAIRAIHANNMAILALPPHSSSLQSGTDVNPTIAGPSLREPNAERTGDLDPLHYPYDIV